MSCSFFDHSFLLYHQLVEDFAYAFLFWGDDFCLLRGRHHRNCIPLDGKKEVANVSLASGDATERCDGGECGFDGWENHINMGCIQSHFSAFLLASYSCVSSCLSALQGLLHILLRHKHRWLSLQYLSPLAWTIYNNSNFKGEKIYRPQSILVNLLKLLPNLIFFFEFNPTPLTLSTPTKPDFFFFWNA